MWLQYTELAEAMQSANDFYQLFQSGFIQFTYVSYEKKKKALFLQPKNMLVLILQKFICVGKLLVQKCLSLYFSVKQAYVGFFMGVGFSRVYLKMNFLLERKDIDKRWQTRNILS